jgi:RNA recognition motif-containing protein
MAHIYVANLDHRSTEASVRSAFEVYGKVEKVDVDFGWAVVEMADREQAEQAIGDLNRLTAWVLRPLPLAA